MKNNINVATDFSETPGGRYIKEGQYSGELFRRDILLPRYKQAVIDNEKLIINLDDCYGYATSFLEEAFGGLVRELKTRNIMPNIEFISEDEPGLIDLIKKYVGEASIE